MAKIPNDKIIALPDTHAIDQNAAKWLARVHSGDISDEHLRLFKKWYDSNPRHAAAYDRVEKTWRALDQLRALDQDYVGAHRPSIIEKISSLLNAWIDWAKTAFIVRPLAAPILASLLAVALVLPMVGVVLKPNLAPTDTLAYVTETGQQKTIDLSDGSKIFLNTASHVEVRYGPRARTIKLLSGEAFFDVAKDRNRPFSVFASDGVVRAVGTAFTVRLMPDEAVAVTVTEGNVALATLSSKVSGAQLGSNPYPVNDANQSPLARLSAGQNALFSRTIKQINPLSNDELKHRLAWRKGTLSYDGQPLLDVLRDIQRYTNLIITTKGDGFENMTVSAHFQIDEIDVIFDVLEHSFDLSVDRSATGVLLTAT